VRVGVAPPRAPGFGHQQQRVARAEEPVEVIARWPLLPGQEQRLLAVPRGGGQRARSECEAAQRTPAEAQ